MKKKRLIVIRVNTLLAEDKQAMVEAVRQRVIKQLKDGVIATDMSCEVKTLDYDCKNIEIKVIDKDDKLVAVKK